MCDNRATPISPTDEGCADWTDKKGNSAEVIKKIKGNNNFHRQSPEPDSNSATELPQPVFREVPVHVRRAQNRSVPALPPPSAQPQALPSRRKDEGRRRPKRLGGNGDGDGSESDSGGDGWRNGRHSPDGPLQKRKAPAPPVDPSSQTTPRLKKMLAAQKPLVLSPEEEERVQSLKRLHAFEKTLGDQLELRHLNSVKSKQKREILLQERRATPFIPEDPAKFEQSQAYLNEYLDESLYSAIVDDRLSNQVDQDDEQTAIVDLIARTESWLTQILQDELSPRGFSFPDQKIRPNTAIQIVQIFRPWSECRSPPGRLLVPGLRLPISTHSEDHYIYLDGDRCKELTHGKDCLSAHYLRSITEDLSFTTFGGLPATELLFYSGRIPSKPKKLTPEYIDWLRLSVGKQNFDDLVHRSRQRIAIPKYKESMSAINMSVSQEFFQSGSGVDLVLVKGGRPSTIRKVLPADLARMGWRQDGEFGRVEQQGAERRYWRYDTFDDDPNEVFVVDMDGDVLGVYAR